RGPASGQVATVRVYVLPQQRPLPHAVGGHRANLLHELRRRSADLASARRGDDAVGACAVAPDADLQPPLKRTRPTGRQMAGEPLELEVALGGDRVARQELREPVHLAGSERDVD